MCGVEGQGKESPMWEQPGGGERWKQKGGIRAETQGNVAAEQERLLVTTKSN